MNERERMNVLRCVTVPLAFAQNLPPCVKRKATGPLSTHQISVQSVQPFPRYGTGKGTAARAHMLTCSSTLRVKLHVRTYLTSTFVKRLAIGSLTTNQISAQFVPPFSRYEKGVHTAHVRPCRCAPPLTFAKSLAIGSRTTYQNSAQFVQPFPRYGKGGTSVRAHVQTYPIHDLRNMHRGLV